MDNEMEKKSFFYYISNNNFIRTILSIICGFIVGAIFLEILGYNSLYVYRTLFNGIFANKKSISNIIVYSSPYILTGLSVVISLKAGIFNIGAEGQYVIGTLGALVIGILFKDLPSIVLIPLCMISAMICGAIFGIIISILKNKFNINEILSMIMFNWIAFYFSNLIIRLSVFKNENGYEASRTLTDNALIIFDKNFISKYGLCSNFNLGILIVIIFSILIYILIEKTTLGYAIKAVGKNIDASRFNGIDVNKISIITLAISGALAGLAGAIQLMGASKRISIYIYQEGYGFAGIVVALIGMVNPIISILSGLFYSALKYSGRTLNLIDAPTQLIDLIVGTIIFFISISSVFKYLANIKIGRKK